MALTKVTGSVIKDSVSLSGNVSIGGTLTYEDVTNVDSVGIITARSTIDAQGDVSIADKIIHTGDTNTAIRFPAVDTISFETSGSERARISSNGKLGVGINDPQNYFSSYNNLVVGKSSDTGGITIVSASGSGGSIAFAKGTSGNQAYRGIIRYDQANDSMTFGTDGGTERLRITSSGTLLLGTSTETNNIRLGNKLAIVGTTPYIGMSITNYPGTNGNHAPMLDFNRSRGTSDQSMTSVAVNDKLGEIIFRGSDGSDFEDGAAIRAFVDNTPANDTTDMPGRLTFCTSGDGDTTLHERCRITSAGELGVNTTAPVEKLGISGNMRFVNPTGTTSRITALPSGSYNTGTSGGSAICFQRFADGGGGSDEIFFETHWQGNRHGESMRINKYGHVTTPNQPSFNVTASGGQLNSNVGTIVFNNTSSVKNHNTGNHYSTSTGRFTAPVAGRYQINARMLTNSSTTAYTIYLLRVNGSHAGYIGHNHSDYWLMESGGWVLNLSANDYVDCYLQQHSGHVGHNYASFSGFLIG